MASSTSQMQTVLSQLPDARRVASSVIIATIMIKVIRIVVIIIVTVLVIVIVVIQTIILFRLGVASSAAPSLLAKSNYPC